MKRVNYLHQAKTAKKDEFYTQLKDIEKELPLYGEHFKNKVIYCNCDDPRVSNFYKYFYENFHNFGLKKLIASFYVNQQLELFLNGIPEKPFNVTYDGVRAKRGYFSGDGDFRSAESIALLKQADIVITNPPFSLFRAFIAQLIKHKKKFIVIGNMTTAMSSSYLFSLIQQGRMWYGASIRGGDREFEVADSYPLNGASCRKSPDGKRYIRVKSVRWFTNLDNGKIVPELKLTKSYTPEKYPKFANFDAIEVSRTKNIPADYTGVMAVPISFLDKYNPEQFKILKLVNHETWIVQDHIYRKTFLRILIKNKKPTILLEAKKLKKEER